VADLVHVLLNETVEKGPILHELFSEGLPEIFHGHCGRWVTIHFGIAAECFGNSVIVIMEHCRKRTKELGSKLGSFILGQLERGFGHFGGFDHGRTLAAYG
jgi:hypothetical protein